MSRTDRTEEPGHTGGARSICTVSNGVVGARNKMNLTKMSFVTAAHAL